MTISRIVPVGTTVSFRGAQEQGERKKRVGFEGLHEETIAEIFAKCAFKDLKVFSQVCKRWHGIVHSLRNLLPVGTTVPSREAHINDLPNNLLTKIFAKVFGPREFLNCANVCKRWKAIFRNEDVWHQIIQSQTPISNWKGVFLALIRTQREITDRDELIDAKDELIAIQNDTNVSLLNTRDTMHEIIADQNEVIAELREINKRFQEIAPDILTVSAIASLSVAILANIKPEGMDNYLLRILFCFILFIIIKIADIV